MEKIQFKVSAVFLLYQNHHDAIHYLLFCMYRYRSLCCVFSGNDVISSQIHIILMRISVHISQYIHLIFRYIFPAVMLCLQLSQDMSNVYPFHFHLFIFSALVISIVIILICLSRNSQTSTNLLKL